MCITRRNRITAFARVISTIRCDTPEVMIRRDLVEQIRQHGRIADAAACDLNGADLQRFLINPNVDLAPQAAFWATHCPAAHACMCERDAYGHSIPLRPQL